MIAGKGITYVFVRSIQLASFLRSETHDLRAWHSYVRDKDVIHTGHTSKRRQRAS